MMIFRRQLFWLLLLPAWLGAGSSPARPGLLVNEGFDGFAHGRRPAGWEFSGINSGDVYTEAGRHGVSAPALKLSGGSRVVSETFPAGDDTFLNFWVKRVGPDPAGSLLVEEYNGSGGSWSSLTAILPPYPAGSVTGPVPLDPHSTRVRFTADNAGGSLALDDVIVRSGPYLRVYFLSWTRLDQSGRYGQVIYAELPGEDGILGTADDVRVLYDGGASASHQSALAAFLDERIGVGGVIDHVVLSHAHQDHYAGLVMVIDRYKVRYFYENFRGGGTRYQNFRDRVDSLDIPVHYFQAGDYLSGPETNVGPGWDPAVEVRVLAALQTYSNPNTDSAILLVRNRQSSFLWGGDATGPAERYAADNFPGELAGTDIYAVHHHGSNTSGSSGQDFLDLMAPRYAVVPVAFRSSSRHPRAETMDRIDRTGAILYRNDLDHHVTVLADASGNYEIARGHLWDGTYSSSADLVFPPPPPVGGLSVRRQTLEDVVLGWEPAGPGDRYLVFRSRMPGGDDGAGRALQAGTAPGGETGIYRRLTGEPVAFTTFTDTSGVPNVSYHYRVAAVRGYSEGGWTTTQERRWSDEVSGYRLAATPTPTPPGYRTPVPTATPIPTATSVPTATAAPTAAPTSSPPPTPPLPEGLIFSEDFSGGLPGNWTVISGYGGDFTWTAENPGERSHPEWNPPFMIVDSDWAGERPLDERLLTPAIDCSDYINVELRFNHYFRHWHRGEEEKGDVEISVAGGPWRNLARYTSTSAGLQRFDISSHADGQSDLRIRWRYYDAEWEWYWGIDNVTVSGDLRPSPTPSPPPSPTATVPLPSPPLPPSPPPATSTPRPGPTASPTPVTRWIYDFSGDGTSDIALFRPAAGLWAVRGVTRLYFGREGDRPVPADYSGDGTTDIAVFREDSALWAIRGLTRRYFGRFGDRPVPADYRGMGRAEIAVFRPETGLWAIRGMTRFYFGRPEDIPLPGYYAGPAARPAVFRPATGLWAVRGLTRFYFGAAGDIPVTGDYTGRGFWSPGIFRPAAGLWAVRGVTRSYFGRPGDRPLPGFYVGNRADDPGIYREESGLWAVRGVTRVNFGRIEDHPVNR